MQPRDKSYLLDILTASQLLQAFIADMERETFETDLKTQSAVIRQLEIIGEATKRLSEEVRTKNTDIPWRQMAGMRDILIHAYDHVNLDQVWYATQTSIPELTTKVQRLLQ